MYSYDTIHTYITNYIKLTHLWLLFNESFILNLKALSNFLERKLKMDIIAKWILYEKNISNGKNKLAIYNYFYGFYILNKEIFVSEETLKKVCNLKENNNKSVPDALKSLEDNGYIKKIPGKFGKNRKSNRYILIEEKIPKEYRVMQEDYSNIYDNRKILKSYIVNLPKRLPEETEDTLLKWIDLKNPILSVDQFRIMLNELRDFCTDEDHHLNITEFNRYIRRAYIGGNNGPYAKFLFKEDYDKKEKERKNEQHKKSPMQYFY